MTINRFDILTKVVDLKSFTKASEVLNMTQSAVSHAINSLESEWGVTLLIRDRKKGIALSEVGQKTLIHMREILNRMDKINQEIALAMNLEVGNIRIGTFSSASSCLLPKILCKFQKKHPHIEFTFFEGTYEEIVEWLETGVIDIGFVVQQDKKRNLNKVPLIKDKMVVAFPVDHKFEGKKTISIQELKNEPFIMPKGMYQTHVNEIFNQANIKPLVRFEVFDCNTIANMVQEGLGITIGPELSLKMHQNIKIGELTITNWRTVALASSLHSTSSPAVQAFLKIAQTVYSQSLTFQ
ncbi:LysR family transcriptional regulator [Shimazuella alba]|uniref:LysR family transcriptional regulator n=1 Tax=Shimazuella alba TaxID=2690964 RepID=A0A6I4VRP2_9BACL|nr:LysR family transcriptional regulator [Shimazuella alba]MXQ53101.1 LysR family transcriptional regulator [Shimazuella alba]